MQVTVAKTAGFCFGVRRALELTQKLVHKQLLKIKKASLKCLKALTWYLSQPAWAVEQVLVLHLSLRN